MPASRNRGSFFCGTSGLRVILAGCAVVFLWSFNVLAEPVVVGGESVASSPAAPVDLGKPVAVEELGAIDPDTIGLLTAASGGLGAKMWTGTSRALASALLLELELPTTSKTLNALARRLLLSAATPPKADDAVPSRFTALRLEKLVMLGDAAEAWQLAARAKPDQVDEITLRLIMEAALVGPDAGAVCDKMPEMVADHIGLAWQKALIICQLRKGDAIQAQLGLDVMREQKTRDNAFISLASYYETGGAGKFPAVKLTPLDSFNLALLSLIDQPLPAELYAHPDAALIPALLRAKTADDNARNALIERAVAQGIIEAPRDASPQPQRTDWPFMALAGEDNPQQGVKVWLDGALNSAVGDDMSRREQAGEILLVLKAAGIAIPGDAWERVITPKEKLKPIVMPSPVLIDRLRDAAKSGRKGEAALLSLLLAGGNYDVPVSVMAEIIGALRQVDLKPEALELARETVTKLLSVKL